MACNTKQGSVSNQTISSFPPVAWHDSDARSEFRLPAYRRTGSQIFRAERSRKNHKDDVLSGDNEIVHHGRYQEGESLRSV